MMHDDPIRADLNSPLRILEVGCGTGFMTNYLAEKYPEAEVIGIDLSPVPCTGVREGVKFIQGDFLELLHGPAKHGLQKGSFDYVFSRMLVFGITDWSGYVARVKEVLAPGGHIELQEIDFNYFDGDEKLLSSSWTWLEDQHTAFLERGLNIYAGSNLATYLKEAEFLDVQMRQFRWIFGKWIGHPETDMIGEYSARYLPPANFGAYSKVMGHKRTQQQLDEVKKQMFEAYAWTDKGGHMRFYVVCAQRL